MRIFYRIVCLFLLSGTSMAVSAQNATSSHYMVFQIPIDTFKVVFDWDYSNPYAISTSDTIDVSSFKKGEIVSKQYVNIPFLVKSDSNVVNVIKLTPNDLLKLPQYGINTWERITKGYNLEINYDTFGTQLVVDDELIPMGKTTLTLEPGVKQAKLVNEGTERNVDLVVQDRIVQSISAKLFLTESEFKNAVWFTGKPFKMTNNAKKANVFRVVTTVFGASSAFFLVSNMTWRELHKRHIDEITDGSSLKKAELSRTFIKSTGVATLVSFTGLTTVYAMHFIQAKKLVRTKEYRSVSATAGLGSLTISAKF